ncbi:tRNA-specific adenosine deaminase subunit tad3 [Coemansia sp. RSA 2050]|nr:tRNA-specific adenosine deaminase subunit tad3 [Coemansia sp. RSA 2050]KAJ2730935.1 tRNA-specific adenosine deaminase subunit tad3 [Coemansia sp. BCRC 34962]
MSALSCPVDIQRVPIEEERQQLVTELVFTITVGPRQTAQILKFIGQRLPKLSGIEHVKRVRKHTDSDDLLVIMCQCSQVSREALDAKLQGTEWETSKVTEHAVPTTAPYTAEQFNLWKTVWPVSFRPPALARTVLSADDREYIEKMLRHVADSLKAGEVAVAICSPKSRLVMAETSVSQASRSVHPLKHAAMCCIARVADAELRRQEGTIPAKRPHSPSVVDGDGDAVAAGYLCEGLDVFASREPCVMCTMALVHSRIGRLFFLSPLPSSGGISRYSMHSCKSLNHHFSAFQCSINSQ